MSDDPRSSGPGQPGPTAPPRYPTPDPQPRFPAIERRVLEFWQRDEKIGRAHV